MKLWHVGFAFGLVLLIPVVVMVTWPHPCRECVAEIWDETLSEAGSHRFNYCGYFHLAKAGDAGALQNLFEFAKSTDAGSALGHGAALMKILQAIGDERFANCIRRQPQDLKRLIGNFIEVGMDYGLDKDPEEAAILFPLSTEAAFEGSKERLFR